MALILSILVGAIAPAVVSSPAAAVDSRPQTIPALRDWIPATSGGFRWTTASRIVLEQTDAAEWGSTGDTVADDFEALTGVRPVVEVSTSSVAQPGDLYLTLRSPDTNLGEEGYRVGVGSVAEISAATVTGAFYGTRTILQLLRRSPTIPAGVMRDWPTTGVRGIWVDTTARYFEMAWWQNLIRDMSYTKMNEIGFQMYGDQLPNDSELAQIVAFAERYHVNITPQRQVASHADLDLLKEYPSYRLDPNASGPANGAFDFTKPGALDIARDAIEETIVKFPGRYFHAGADEYLTYESPAPWDSYPRFAQFARNVTGDPNATGPDALDWYLNWINDIVRSHGKVLAIWNDSLEPGGVVHLDREIIVDHWRQPCCNNAISAPALADPAGADGGHRLVNSNLNYLYYNQGYGGPDPRPIYENFTPYRFDSRTSGSEDLTGAAAANVFGAMIALWTYQVAGNRVESNDEIAARLFGPLRSLAQVTWGTPKIYSAYGLPGQGYLWLMDRLGRAPGYRVSTPTHNSGPGPAITLEMNGEESIARNSGGLVRHGYQIDAGEGPWGFETFPSTILNNIAQEPVMTRQVDGTVTLVARRADGSLVQATQYVGGSGPWEYRALGAVVAGRPKILADRQGRLTLAARRSEGTLLFGRQEMPRGAWTFTTVGSGLTGNPATSLDSAGRIAILARNTAGSLTLLRQATPTSDSFTASTIGLGGVVGTPALASDKIGNLAYFVRTTNGSLQHGRETSPGSSTWSYQTPAGGVAGDPAIELDLNGRLVWFARRADGHLQHGWETVPGARTFTVEDLATGITGDPSVANDIAGRVTYFALDTTGNVKHGYQTKPGAGPWGTCHLEVDC
jgi:hexosaminidase